MNKYIVFPLLAMVLAVGCSGGGSYESAQDAQAGASSSPATTASPKQGSPTLVTKNELPRQVVKTGSLTLQVDNVDKAEKQARSIAEGAQGRVDKVTSSDLAGPAPTITLTLRVPVAAFDSVVEKLEGIGVRMSKSVSVDDVTEKLVDMDARLKTMLAQEQALRNMLAKTGKMSDSLAVNRELTDLRGEIESMAAQRKSLGGQAAYSTLEVVLSQKPNVATVASSDPNWLQSAWADAWGAANSFFRGIVSVGIWLLVFSPLWVALILAIRWLIRSANRSSRPTPSA